MNIFPKRTIRDISLDGKTILLRADYNVPFNDDGSIADDYRILQSLPTLQYLLQRNCKVIVCAHLGRPDGEVNQKYSLFPVATHLSELLESDVAFIPLTVGDRVRQSVKLLAQGKVALLENLRFHPGEEANDEKFAHDLYESVRPDYFVQDGFGVVHRAHASTDAITHLVPSVGGLLLEKEYTSIVSVMEHPKKPLVAILGGAKISDKIKVVERFVTIADKVLIGGAMANTFLAYNGVAIGKSKAETGLDDVIDAIYKKASARGGKERIILPVDVAVAHSVEPNERRSEVDVNAVQEDELILDIGQKTAQVFQAHLSDAVTVVWNGTLGMSEREQFAEGSRSVALAITSSRDVTSVIGGGDTADFVLHGSQIDRSGFTHISTGGGASLELMAGEPMPGIDALLPR